MVTLVVFVILIGVALLLIRDLAPEPLGKYLRIAVLVLCLLTLLGWWGGWVPVPSHAAWRLGAP